MQCCEGSRSHIENQDNTRTNDRLPTFTGMNMMAHLLLTVIESDAVVHAVFRGFQVEDDNVKPDAIVVTRGSQQPRAEGIAVQHTQHTTRLQTRHSKKQRLNY
jgi:hypothetical protein